MKTVGDKKTAVRKSFHGPLSDETHAVEMGGETSAQRAHGRPTPSMSDTHITNYYIGQRITKNKRNPPSR